MSLQQLCSLAQDFCVVQLSIFLISCTLELKGDQTGSRSRRVLGKVLVVWPGSLLAPGSQGQDFSMTQVCKFQKAWSGLRSPGLPPMQGKLRALQNPKPCAIRRDTSHRRCRNTLENSHWRHLNRADGVSHWLVSRDQMDTKMHNWPEPALSEHPESTPSH